MSTGWVIAYLVLALAVVLLALLTLGMAQQMRSLIADPRGAASPHGTTVGLPIGTVLADRGIDGHARGAVLVFVESGCTPCRDLITSLREGVPRGGDTRLLLISQDDPAWLEPIPPGWTLLNETEHSLEADITPLAYAVDDVGTLVAKTIPNTAEDVVRLIETARQAQHHHQ